MKKVQLIILFSLFLYSCIEIPYVKRKAFIIIPEPLEYSLGLSTYEEISKKYKVLKEGILPSLVKEIGENIAISAPKKGHKWEFRVFEAPDIINAFCLPGGKIGVYSGLLDLIQDTNELAFVLAHEIAHAVLRHGSERLSLLLLKELGEKTLEEFVKEKPERTKSLVMIAYNVLAIGGVLLPYSRKQEIEADLVGLILMKNAGYNPESALSFFEKMTKIKKDKIPEWLSTHPSDEVRIRKIREFLKKSK